MSYLLKGKESFDSAHFLRGHDGKCANLHGHRWTVEFGLRADTLIPEGSSKGMVADFTDIKKMVKDLVDNYDHKLLMEEVPQTDSEYPSREEQFVMSCCNMDFPIIFLPFRTTAENMSKHFFEKLQEAFDLLPDQWNIEVEWVTVYETPNNAVTWRGDK